MNNQYVVSLKCEVRLFTRYHPPPLSELYQLSVAWAVVSVGSDVSPPVISGPVTWWETTTSLQPNECPLSQTGWKENAVNWIQTFIYFFIMFSIFWILMLKNNYDLMWLTVLVVSISINHTAIMRHLNLKWIFRHSLNYGQKYSLYLNKEEFTIRKHSLYMLVSSLLVSLHTWTASSSFQHVIYLFLLYPTYYPYVLKKITGEKSTDKYCIISSNELVTVVCDGRWKLFI